MACGCSPAAPSAAAREPDPALRGGDEAGAERDAAAGRRVPAAGDRREARFDHFQLEHINGVGGDLAKLIGEAAQARLEQWRPSLERDLLERADAAVVKAADTKEVRLSVMKLFKAE